MDEIAPSTQPHPSSGHDSPAGHCGSPGRGAGVAGQEPDGPVPVLRARGPADLLGYAGHVLGALRPGSVVLMTMAEGRLRATVRVDPPRDGATTSPESLRAWAHSVAQVCRNDGGAVAAVAVAFETGEEPRFWSALDDGLAAVGIGLQEAWWAVGGRARPWEGSRGHGGGVRIDPRTSDVSLHLVGRGSVWGLREADLTVPDRRAAGPAPAGPEQAVAGSADVEVGHHAPAGRAGRAEWLTSWEPILDARRPAPEGPGPSAAALAEPLRRPLWRDSLLLRAAAGPEADRLDEGRRGAVLSAGDGRPPCWRRMDRLWHAARSLSVHASDEAAAQALGVAAWVAWARGQGSAAGVHLQAGLALDPSDRFLTLLSAVVDAGLVAPWAADPATAWRP